MSVKLRFSVEKKELFKHFIQPYAGGLLKEKKSVRYYAYCVVEPNRRADDLKILSESKNKEDADIVCDALNATGK